MTYEELARLFKESEYSPAKFICGACSTTVWWRDLSCPKCDRLLTWHDIERQGVSYTIKL